MPAIEGFRQDFFGLNATVFTVMPERQVLNLFPWL